MIPMPAGTHTGKGAYPNYIMDGVIDGFPEMSPKIGISSVVNASQMRGVWTWTRGGMALPPMRPKKMQASGWMPYGLQAVGGGPIFTSKNSGSNCTPRSWRSGGSTGAHSRNRRCPRPIAGGPPVQLYRPKMRPPAQVFAQVCAKRVPGCDATCCAAFRQMVTMAADAVFNGQWGGGVGSSPGTYPARVLLEVLSE